MKTEDFNNGGSAPKPPRFYRFFHRGLGIIVLFMEEDRALQRCNSSAKMNQRSGPV